MRVELRLQPLALDAERVDPASPSVASPERSKRPSRSVNRPLLRSRAMRTERRTWWERPGLEVRDGRLAVAGRDAEHIARDRRHARVRARPRLRPRAGARAARRDGRRRAATSGSGSRSRRSATPGSCGSCAPRRRSSGWTCAPPARSSGRSSTVGPRRRSATPGRTCRTATSTRSLPTGVHVNVDLLSQLERLGRTCARLDGRDPREPGHRGVDLRWRRDEVRGEQADEVRHPARSTRRRGGDRRRARANDRHGALPHRATST